MNFKEIVFPKPDLVWTESDFSEELIWVPYPNYSFKQLKPIYDDEIYENNLKFLTKNKNKF